MNAKLVETFSETDPRLVWDMQNQTWRNLTTPQAFNKSIMEEELRWREQVKHRYDVKLPDQS